MVKEQPKTNTISPIPPAIIQPQPEAILPVIEVTTPQIKITPEVIIEQTIVEPETFTQGGLFEIATIQSPVVLEPTVNELQEECFECTIECVEEKEPSITAEDFQTWRKQAQKIGHSFKHLKQIDKLQN